MISSEVVALKEALMAAGTTNSEEQALKWAHNVIEYLETKQIVVCPEDWLNG